ncbi:O-antigen ligase family protein [Lysobacter fragariae]
MNLAFPPPQARRTEPARRAEPFLLFYAIPIALLPNTAHLPSDVSVGVSTALLVLAMLLGRRDPSHLQRPGMLVQPLAALFLAMLIGFIAAQWHDLSHAGKDLREAKVAVLFPFLYLAYLRCGLDLRGTRQLIVLVLLVAVGAGLEAVLQGLHFNLGAFSETQRATGPFGQIKMANRAGVFFAMFLPMLVAITIQPRQRLSVRLVAVAGSVILATAIMFTFSRQSYLIGLFVIMILLVWRSIPIALLAAALLVATSASFLPKSAVERVQQTQQVDASGAVTFDMSTTSRFTIWNGTIDMLRDHPAGVGLGRFGDHIGDYTTYAGKDAHNGFLLTLAECGPLGLLALLWVFWRLWRLARWLRRSPAAARPEARTFELGFTLAVVSMALGNMYGSPFFDSLIMANFWILCGLMERYGTLKARAAALVAAHEMPRVVPKPADVRFPLAARALPALVRNKALRR